MEYWLFGYDTTCPTGWKPTPASTATNIDCSLLSEAVAVPPQTIVPALSGLSLTAQANAAGSNADTIIIWSGNNVYTVAHESILNLSRAWHSAEFNVFGDCYNYAAQFNIGAQLDVVTVVNSGTPNAPICVQGSFTGETSNFTLSSPCATIGRLLQAITFTERVPVAENCSRLAMAISNLQEELDSFDESEGDGIIRKGILSNLKKAQDTFHRYCGGWHQ